MNFKNGCLAAAAALAVVSMIDASASAAAFTAGDLVVTRMGDGTAALSSAATAVFLDEYPVTGGASVNTIGLPTSASGGQHALTDSGSATSDSFFSRTGNGSYLVIPGYDSAVGTAGVVGSAAARVVGRVDASGTVDTSTSITDGFTANNLRSAASADGTLIYLAGNGSPASSGGVRSVAFGATSSTSIESTVSNIRVVNVQNSQLYASSGSGSNIGVNTIGSGVPNTSGQTITLQAADGGSSPSPYDYYFANSSTLYIADDRATASGGGLLKYTSSDGGTTFALSNTFASGLTAGLRGLTGVTVGGVTTLYATTADATTATAGNKLVAITDTGAASSFATLATAGGNQAFRGVDFVPIATPEPTSLALFGIPAMMMLRRRR